MQEKQAKAQSGGANLDTKTRKKEKKKEERPWEQRRKPNVNHIKWRKAPSWLGEKRKNQKCHKFTNKFSK
jgi:hypothetical protein